MESMSRPRSASHELHETIGSLVDRIGVPGVEIVKDSACEGESKKLESQRIPLYFKNQKGRDTWYCNVDILFLDKSGLRVIVEIEETGIKPTKIYGKLLTSAMARFYIHRKRAKKPVPMAKRVLFVQVLKSPQSGDMESREMQWENIRTSLKEEMPIGQITDYELVYGSSGDFRSQKGIALLDFLTSFLNETV